MANAPNDLVFKFDTTTDTSQIFALTASPLAEGETGISFNLQIVEKFGATFGPYHVGSTVVGSDVDKFNTTTSRDLANLIARFFSDKGILVALPSKNTSSTARNIHSMKLIVNVDPTT